MRDAALELAAQRDDFAPSLARRIAEALAAPFARLGARRRARRDLARLSELDAAALADIGLAPHDLAGLPARGDPRAILRDLGRRAAQRSRERWM